MCNASIGFYRNAKQDGIVEGKAEKTLEMVASAMRNGGMSAEEAMELLSVPETERSGLLVKLGLN